ncbi:short-chain dehydrogenase TIC 32, chloroplastic-like [Rhododendron vialii]|uniref:short-chain dehydrogenase TIC 32, chloroplastic-like n=1 Tax=Rhododendron vialii TaxID=182163 RepID=UPI00265E57B3|nr:short-chain dehydrogenase TIC 32, chloroplastic-like [Rhododendron vialii]
MTWCVWVVSFLQLPGRRSGDNCQFTYPGIINTSLFCHHNTFRGLMNIGKYFVKSVPQGAATTCYIALHPQVKGLSGEYFPTVIYENIALWQRTKN